MDNEETFDIGENAAGLGWGYLFFRYVWPVIIGVGVIVLILLALRWTVFAFVPHAL